MQIADVAIIGGGPSGTAAAITLARAGRSVVLIDKARFPRDKCCGDGLTTGALRHLDALGLQPADVASWQDIDDVWVRSPSGRSVAFPLPRHAGRYGAVARRRDLDAAMVDLARASGVTVHEGASLIGARHTPDDEATITLAVDGLGPVRARYAIGADGAWSPLRKAVGAAEPGYLGEWHAFRQYLTGVTGSAASQLWVWFEPDLLPGYAWSFPLPGGGANVGFGIRRSPEGGPTRWMAERWRELLARPHIAEALGPDAVTESPHKAWPIPARLGRTTLDALGGRVLFVGDAARATDPMTGEGIGQALETGVLAAQAVLTAGALRPADAAGAYRRSLHSGMVVDSALAGFLSTHAIAHRRGIRTAVRVAGATGWTRRNFARWLFEDYPRAVLATPWRWHRDVLTGPGAYR